MNTSLSWLETLFLHHRHFEVIAQNLSSWSFVEWSQRQVRLSQPQLASPPTHTCGELFHSGLKGWAVARCEDLCSSPQITISWIHVCVPLHPHHLMRPYFLRSLHSPGPTSLWGALYLLLRSAFLLRGAWLGLESLCFKSILSGEKKNNLQLGLQADQAAGTGEEGNFS